MTESQIWDIITESKCWDHFFHKQRKSPNWRKFFHMEVNAMPNLSDEDRSRLHQVITEWG